MDGPDSLAVYRGRFARRSGRWQHRPRLQVRDDRSPRGARGPGGVQEIKHGLETDDPWAAGAGLALVLLPVLPWLRQGQLDRRAQRIIEKRAGLEEGSLETPQVQKAIAKEIDKTTEGAENWFRSQSRNLPKTAGTRPPDLGRDCRFTAPHQRRSLVL
jgi:hypothetical protein